MKKYVILVLFLVISLTGCTKDEYYQSTDISKYYEYIDIVTKENECEFFPNLDDIEDVESVDLSYLEKKGSLVRSNSLMVTLKFHEGDYGTKKDEFIAQFDYIDEIMLDSDNEPVITSNSFKYNGYNILIVKDERFDYPKNFGMVGYSDEKNELIFLYFSDSDMDYITDVNHFMDTNFLFDDSEKN